GEPACVVGSVRTTARGKSCDPGEAQVLDRRLVDLLERTVALAAVIARVSGPLIGKWLEDLGRIKSALADDESWCEQQVADEKAFHMCPYRVYLIVAR